MISIVQSIHNCLTPVFDLAWKPIAGFDLTLQLCLVSIFFGVFMVWIFGWVSPQAKIKQIKSRISALLIESFLFRYEIKSALTAQYQLLKAGATYLFLAIIPVLVLAIPFTFILAQVNARVGYTGWKQGSPLTITLQAAANGSERDFSIEVPSDVTVKGPVRLTKERSAIWQLWPSRVESFPIAINLSKSSSGVSPAVSARLEAAKGSKESRSPYLKHGMASDLTEGLLYPSLENGSDGTLSSSSDAVSRFWVEYPDRSFDFFGSHVSWLTPFLIISIIAGYLGSRFLKIAV